MLSVDITLALRDSQLTAAFDVSPGCLALVGPSGSGKTSILRAIAGLSTPIRGHVAINGDTIFHQLRKIDTLPERRRCGFVPQDYALFPNLSAIDNIAYAMSGLRQRPARERAREWLDRFDLGPVASEPVTELSGGERQRVAVARALASNPLFLLLDEPLAALDPASRERAIDQLRQTITTAALPTVLVSHDPSDAAMLADRVALIDGDRVVVTNQP